MSDNYPAGLETTSATDTAPDALDGRRDVRLTQRYSAAEASAVEARARALGVKPGAWVRAVVRDALDARRAEVAALHGSAATRPDPQRATAVEQLRRVGVNLNQLVRAINADGELTDHVEDLLDAVEAVRPALNGVRAEFGDRTRL
ncbi:hypothetical protein nbrc107696_27010 [Gordonia spumicola]|uniref:Bacterial mobilisation domain-containing protein n=1 Tax=Gordonia spumicola TaxID=589161 RepID=A0A7I9VAB6_9ACTN|nr:hypothetical protein nbrc107696_27010 [Gordonia spumicola]